MKLYYAPGACSLSPHIALREAGIPFQLEKVDFATKKVASGADFNSINPKGYVPALELDNGQLLTEGPAIVQYVADLKPDSGLAPQAGTWERVRLQEALSFITSEIHKSFGPLFRKANAEWQQAAKENIAKRFDYVSKNLGSNDYLFGKQFTVADGYLFVMLHWTKFVEFDLGKWPTLQNYAARVSARPKVQEALKAEGLAK